jgi:hypothetical protein
MIGASWRGDGQNLAPAHPGAEAAVRRHNEQPHLARAVLRRKPRRADFARFPFAGVRAAALFVLPRALRARLLLLRRNFLPSRSTAIRTLLGISVLCAASAFPAIVPRVDPMDSAMVISTAPFLERFRVRDFI